MRSQFSHHKYSRDKEIEEKVKSKLQTPIKKRVRSPRKQLRRYQSNINLNPLYPEINKNEAFIKKHKYL